MNAIERVNQVAELWLDIVVDRSLAATLALATLSLIWLALRRLCSSHVGSALFLGALVPLVVPVEKIAPGYRTPAVLDSAIESVRTWLPHNSAIAPPRAEIDARSATADVPLETLANASGVPDESRGRRDTTSNTIAPQKNDQVPNSEHAGAPSQSAAAAETRTLSRIALPSGTTSDSSRTPSAATIAFLSWSATVLLLLGVFARNQLRTRRRVRSARSLHGHPIAELMPELCRISGVTAPVRLVASDTLASPATSGLRRPVLLLPESLVDELSPEQLRWVLLHELAHIRRGDLWISLGQQLLQILYFFHPAVWVANALVDQHRECACDDAALSRCQSLSRKECARTFLRVVEQAQCSPGRDYGLVSLFDRHSLLRRRLMRLADPNRRVLRGLTRPAYGFLAVATLGGWTASHAQLAEPKLPPTPTINTLVSKSSNAVGTPTASGPANTPVQADTPVQDNTPVQADTRVQADTGELREAIERAVDWLVRHQNPDGSWNRDGLGASAPLPQEYAATETTGIVPDPFDPSVVTAKPPSIPRAPEPSPVLRGATDRSGWTGLAVLGLLESDRAQSDTAVRSAWERGRDYLIQKQNTEDGCLASKNGNLFIYAHLMSAQALLKCLRRKEHADCRVACQSALNFLARSRNPYRAWRYDYPPAGDNDTSVSGIAILTLLAGDRLGLEVDNNALLDGLRYLDEMTDPATGRTGYTEPGSPSARTPKDLARFPPELTEAMTAVALNVRLAMGELPGSPTVGAGAELLAQRLPQWQANGSSVDYYYWFFGMAAMRAIGGPAAQNWRLRIHQALLPTQERAPTAAQGAWPKVGVWSEEGGAVYTTVLALLALRHSQG